ncbi:protein lin-54 homolog [Hetaerina americana]|uniref:protein lin-54 homolog n=1 Tax=Hetaerina americana TaxID=62018 RepID=UPI003A7F12C8
MNEDTVQAQGSQAMVDAPLSPVKVQQNVGQGLRLMRVPSSITGSPTKITVIPATMRNAPIRIIPAPNIGGAMSNQLPVSTSGQQRIFIQASPAVQGGGVNPVMAAVTSTGQIVHYTAQNIVKTKSVPKIQGKQLQYVQYVNAVKSGPAVSCVSTPVTPTAQLPLKSGPTLQMVVIPQAKQDPQTSKAKALSTVKPKPMTEEVSKDDPKSARGKNVPLDILLPRKPCNCTKSQCLKLYCECFANGEFCNNCKCLNCSNNLEHEEERQKAIKLCLDRNRDAFRPKIGKGTVGDGRRHNKGCQCKRSGCLKNYCECYEAKISCTDMCRCVGCRNSTKPFLDGNAALKTIVDMENFHDPFVKLKGIKSESQHQKTAHLSYASKKPRVLMSSAVIEATCQCLVAQVVDAHQKDVSDSHLERVVLEEFGKCMVQIVQSARSLKTVSNGKEELS